MTAMHACTCFTERQKYKCSYYVGQTGVRLKTNSHLASLPGFSEPPKRTVRSACSRYTQAVWLPQRSRHAAKLTKPTRARCGCTALAQTRTSAANPTDAPRSGSRRTPRCAP